MDRKDQDLLRKIQFGIPIVKEPFATFAKELEISEDELIARLKKLKRKGVIRRFGAKVNHRRIGITANAMVAWKVPRNRVKPAGEIMSRCKAVTHCYERQIIPGKWEYNLFAVIHGYNRETVKQHVKRLSEVIGVNDYLLLFSNKEFKRATTGRIT